MFSVFEQRIYIFYMHCCITYSTTIIQLIFKLFKSAVSKINLNQETHCNAEIPEVTHIFGSELCNSDFFQWQIEFYNSF